MRNRPRTDWAAIKEAVYPPLFKELCRVFHAGDRAMLCALSHGQVAIDGYVIRPEHLDRWPPEKLIGRYAYLVGRSARLYGSTPVR